MYNKFIQINFYLEKTNRNLPRVGGHFQGKFLSGVLKTYSLSKEMIKH